MQVNNLTILAAGTFLRGDLFSDDIIVVEGGIEGNIIGNKVVVKRKGWIQGSLTCRALSIELGGVVNGAVRVIDAPALPAAPPKAELPDDLPLEHELFSDDPD